MRVLLLSVCASALACSAMAQSYDQDQGGYNTGGYSGQERRDQSTAPNYDQNDQYRDNQTDRDDQGYQDDRGDNGYRDNRDDQGDRYDRSDQDSGSRYDRGDQNDQSDRYDQDQGSQYGYGVHDGAGWRGTPQGAQFTGRTGATWRDPEGRYCIYREYSWTGANGEPAYQWVPRCRY